MIATIILYANTSGAESIVVGCLIGIAGYGLLKLVMYFQKDK
jgi:hypothetical protein